MGFKRIEVTMKFTILIDNLPHENLVGEWGLAVYIEHGGKKILLDAGASDGFAKNAESLGIDLSGIDYAALSHAHFDHSDGMDASTKKHSSIFGPAAVKTATAKRTRAPSTSASAKASLPSIPSALPMWMEISPLCPVSG